MSLSFSASEHTTTDFTRKSSAARWGIIGSQCGGPLGEVVLTDDNGDRHRFYFETFFNRYDALTLGLYLQPVYCTIRYRRAGSARPEPRSPRAE